jgi:hypothetical protein
MKTKRTARICRASRVSWNLRCGFRYQRLCRALGPPNIDAPGVPHERSATRIKIPSVRRSQHCQEANTMHAAFLFFCEREAHDGFAFAMWLAGNHFEVQALITYRARLSTFCKCPYTVLPGQGKWSILSLRSFRDRSRYLESYPAEF